jgi:hypothetical protein
LECFHWGAGGIINQFECPEQEEVAKWVPEFDTSFVGYYDDSYIEDSLYELK